jgi:RNA polymerase sigma-70 factor (sigma-E family)
LDRDTEFGEFVDARALVMRRTAYLLCGDWHRAEDIVQSALIKLYVAWTRVRKDSVDAYARKVLVRTAIDETRRGFFNRERSVDAVPEVPVADPSSDLDLRVALDALPPGQRAVVVLRYWEDLSVTETARILGRTEGTVKSQAAKGLAALRELLEDEPESKIYTAEVIKAGKTRLARRRTAVATAVAALVMIAVGSVSYVAMPRPASGPETAAAPVDRNEELTRILRDANVIPPGVTVHDVGADKALNFYSKDQIRYATARLTDGKGGSGLVITLRRVPDTGTAVCETPASLRDCYSDPVTGNHIATFYERGAGGVVTWRAVVTRPGGTWIEIKSDNIGAFRTGGPPEIEATAASTRPEPVLGRDALIKIATLPGLTF